MSQQQHIDRLWQLYIADEATDEQLKELLEHLKNPADDTVNEDYFVRHMKGVPSLEGEQSAGDRGRIWQMLLESRPDLREAWTNKIEPDEKKNLPATRRISVLRMPWFRYAAIFVIIVGLAAYLWNISGTNRPTSILAKTDTPPPASMKATITLSDGRIISLDTAKAGIIATDGNVIIEKLANGNIAYKGLAAGEIKYNTVVVPRGSKIASLTLSDGTIVFLNSESSLRYPVSFAGSERRVQITCEAYFEVEKNPSKKFVVETSDMITEVLGTRFNINSYAGEQNNKTTLLQGSVKVTAFNQSIILNPGEQVVSQNKNLQIVKNADLNNVMAWKNGIFIFSNNRLDEVLRDVARWYDINVLYAGPVPDIELYGKIGRDLSLHQVLQILADMNVKYTMKDARTLIILSE